MINLSRLKINKILLKTRAERHYVKTKSYSIYIYIIYKLYYLKMAVVKMYTFSMFANKKTPKPS